MLVSFEGIGCEQCPFFSMTVEDENYYARCGLDGLEDASGVRMDIELGEHDSPPDDWPDGCPFHGQGDSLEIQAIDK